MVRESLQGDPSEIELTETDSWDQFLSYVQAGDHDLVLSDLNFAAPGDPDVLGIVQEKLPEAPVVMLTTTGGEAMAAESVKRGAADYVIKSPDQLLNLYERLQSAVQRHSEARLQPVTAKDLREEVHRLEVLRQIERTILNSSPPHETAREALEIIDELLAPQHASVIEFDFGSGRAITLAVSGLGVSPFDQRASLDLQVTPFIERLQGGGVILDADMKKPAEGETLRHSLFRGGVRSMASFPLRTAGELFGVLNIGYRKTGPLPDAYIDLVGEIAELLAFSLQQARTFSEIHDRAERLSTLQDSITAVNQAISLQEKFKTIQSQILDIHPNHLPPAFGIVQPEGEVIVPYILDMDDPELVRFESETGFDLASFQLPMDQIVPEHMTLIEAGFPVVLEDPLNDLSPYLPEEIQQWLGSQQQFKNLLVIPFAFQSQLLGLMFVAGPRRLNREEVRMLTALANQAAIAFQNARLFELVRGGRHRLQNLSKQLLDVQEAERRHIARELHDQIGQALTALKINLQALEKFLPSGDGDIFLHESIEIAEQTLQQVRNLSLDLRPSLLDDLGLVPAVRWYLDRQGQRTGIKIQFVSEMDEDRLPAEIETTCFRVIQEALTNVIRHAEAKRVRVELLRRPDRIELIMRDDGVGFDVKAALEDASRGQSLGILGLQERVYMIGGFVHFESVLHHGTEIHAQLPIDLSTRLERRSSRR